MTLLMYTGILTTDEALSGFSNPATITIGAMFVVSEGIRRTGALEIVGDYFSALGSLNYWIALALMMLIIAVISAGRESHGILFPGHHLKKVMAVRRVDDICGLQPAASCLIDTQPQV